MTARGVLGLDIGGSKTHAVLRTDEGARELLRDSANTAAVGTEAAAAVLHEIARDLCPAGVAAVCAGAAGADTHRPDNQMSRLLREAFPGAVTRVVHDSRIVLAAEGLAAGCVLIAGTGSVAWARTSSGEEVQAGGWGYLLGDEGGGYGITRDAVRHVLGERDRGEPPCALGRRLLEAAGVGSPDALLAEFYARPDRKHWAGLSRQVLALAAAGEPHAEALQEDAARALAELGLLVNRRLGLAGPVVLAGGVLIHQPVLRERVRTLLAGRGIDDVRALRRPPVWGALALAEKLLTTPTPPQEGR